MKIIKNSFDAYLIKGTSRSTDKLIPLHGAIAQDIATRLGNSYDVWSKGYLHNKEEYIKGRYIEKTVDITIRKNDITVAGIAVKFIMQNYAQNSNNYFENMLGETANIRSNNIPYFQIFIILDKLPYFNKKKEITRWESFNKHNMDKYLALSNDNIDAFYHTPNKTLIYVVHLSDCTENTATANEYINYYRTNEYEITTSSQQYGTMGNAVILNDYETFISKVYHTILSL